LVCFLAEILLLRFWGRAKIRKWFKIRFSNFYWFHLFKNINKYSILKKIYFCTPKKMGLNF
jgi:hypothetical protein